MSIVITRTCFVSREPITKVLAWLRIFWYCMAVRPTGDLERRSLPLRISSCIEQAQIATATRMKLLDCWYAARSADRAFLHFGDDAAGAGA
eukprot:SAG31_NODE_328_length_17643_cov_46.707649_2_plen_91_part_00